MASKLSRRKLAQYVVDTILSDGNQNRAVQQLAAYLIESQRIEELDLIVRDVEYSLATKGHVIADVTTAYGLNAQTKKQITQLASESFQASVVEIREQIDPHLLGGAKIDLPGLRLDDTLHKKLTLLRATTKI